MPSKSELSSLPVPLEVIERKIYLLRGQKIMLDSDLAGLYGVETKALNRAVKRNSARFPADFMFQLTVEEAESLRCQIGTSNERRGGRRYLPYVFTEQGVAMLSSVLKSERAIQVNIAIMRAFVKLRELLATNQELAEQLAALERRYDAQLQLVFQALNLLMAPPPETPPTNRRIGFRANKETAKNKSSNRKR
jgi:phage regulator Rha-like protein